MKKVCLAAVAVVLAFSATASADIWVNEIHYDNVSGDLNESIEVVVAPNMAGTDLSSIVVELYNGSNGETYDSETLDNFSVGASVNGYQFYTWAPGSIQNGAPDGWAVSDGVSVFEFLSYEGTLTATNGAANGLTSTDIGVSESGTTLETESLQLTGTGATPDLFSWSAPIAATSGAINTGQSFPSVVPEPSALALLGLASLKLVTRRRRETISEE